MLSRLNPHLSRLNPHFSGTDGGVGWFSQSQVSISATRFDSLNKALGSGSALFLQGSSVLVCSNCSFVGMTLSGDNNINGGMICALKVRFTTGFVYYVNPLKY